MLPMPAVPALPVLLPPVLLLPVALPVEPALPEVPDVALPVRELLLPAPLPDPPADADTLVRMNPPDDPEPDAELDEDAPVEPLVPLVPVSLWRQPVRVMD